jgi:hypothetical protein
MGAINSKLGPCPFEQLLRNQRSIAKSTRYTIGKASAFYFLCKEGKIDGVRQILDDKTSPPIDILNQLQPNGSTALHAATYFNHQEIVRLLLERDCPRTQLNRFGNTAYEEAQTDEMRQLFNRSDPANRFHETNTENIMSLYLPEENIEDVSASKTFDYVQVFKTQSEILEYTINQQTTAMWVKFYDWFVHTFRIFIERDELHVDEFDLINHPDFKQFLKRSLSEANIEKTMESVAAARRFNSVEPLITLYTSEVAGFYRPFNQLLAQTLSDPKISPHLCDRFITEFYIRRQELKRRAYTGTVYRGATMPVGDLVIYQHSMDSKPPGVIGLKAFTSTSRDALIALEFAFKGPPDEGQEHVIFVFEILEPSATIFGIDDISVYGHEQEVLILPGNLFTVTKIQKDPNLPFTKIYLKHWKTSISFWKKIKQTMRAGKTPVIPRGKVE